MELERMKDMGREVEGLEVRLPQSPTTTPPVAR